MTAKRFCHSCTVSVINGGSEFLQRFDYAFAQGFKLIVIFYFFGELTQPVAPADIVFSAQLFRLVSLYVVYHLAV